MKKLILFLAICMAGAGAFAQTGKHKASKTDSTMKKVYTCPMHPEVISDKPGKCPKCGMNLVEKEMVVKKTPAKKESM